MSKKELADVLRQIDPNRFQDTINRAASQTFEDYIIEILQNFVGEIAEELQRDRQVRASLKKKMKEAIDNIDMSELEVSF